jgi:RNA polymerase sigma factor (sigma-70 family)
MSRWQSSGHLLMGTEQAMDDQQLLNDYAQTGSQSVFAEIVARHIDWVYSVSRRRVIDAALADDVTQAVFIILAKKADKLPPGTILAGWLMKAIQYSATDALKRQSRRRRYERKAAKMNQNATPDSLAQSDWDELMPCVDEALLRLPIGYRDAITLRFYRRQSYAEIAVTMGLSEEAAKKRVSRGLDKLRSLLGPKAQLFSAATFTCAAATLAPPALHAAVISAATSGQAGSALLIAQGAMNLMAWTKAKVAVAIVVAGLSFGGTAAIFFSDNAQHEIAAAPHPAATLVLPNKPAATPVIEPASPMFDNRLLHFTAAGGVFDQFHLSVPIQALPQREIAASEVLVERDGESATILVRSARESFPYAYVVNGFLVQLDGDNPGGVIVASGVSADVVLRANRPGSNVMTEVGVAAAANKRIDVNVGSLIDQLRQRATGSNRDEVQNLIRYCDAHAGGRIVLAVDAPPDLPPVASYSVTESARLAVQVRDIQVGPSSLVLPRLSLALIERLGISIRRLQPTAAMADLLPPAGFFQDRAHQVTANKLNSLLQRRDRGLVSAEPRAMD